MQTLLACWEENARGASGASLQRLPGVTAAVFPNEPERLVYNNAVLERGVDAVDTMEEAYAAAGVTRFAAWVHESAAASAQRSPRCSCTTRSTAAARRRACSRRRWPSTSPPQWAS